MKQICLCRFLKKTHEHIGTLNISNIYLCFKKFYPDYEFLQKTIRFLKKNMKRQEILICSLSFLKKSKKATGMPNIFIDFPKEYLWKSIEFSQTTIVRLL